MSEKLTDMQGKIISFIREYQSTKGYSPSIREIGDAVDLKSSSSVHGQLKSLIRKNIISMDSTKPRTIEILVTEEDTGVYDRNELFIAKDVASYKGVKYSVVVDVVNSTIKYDILDMVYKFDICCSVLMYSWRRKVNETISRANIEINFGIEKNVINDIPFFTYVIGSDVCTEKKVIEIISNRLEIKQALLERYLKQAEVIIDEFGNSPMFVSTDNRLCGLDTVIGVYTGNIENEDEFKRLLQGCIIKVY